MEDENSVTMVDVLKEQEAFEEDANAVLGASDDKNCTFSLGYVKRQALYACLTCCPDSIIDPNCRAGICLACSLACHENHDLIELYTKRNFCCDCGGPQFPTNPCTFNENKPDKNIKNQYNQNFSGVYCICHRPYPDPEATEEDEMIQCVVCEDWLHSKHLNTKVPPPDQYSEMVCQNCMDANDFLGDYVRFKVSDEDNTLNESIDTNIADQSSVSMNSSTNENSEFQNKSDVQPGNEAEPILPTDNHCLPHLVESETASNTIGKIEESLPSHLQPIENEKSTLNAETVQSSSDFNPKNMNIDSLKLSAENAILNNSESLVSEIKKSSGSPNESIVTKIKPLVDLQTKSLEIGDDKKSDKNLGPTETTATEIELEMVSQISTKTNEITKTNVGNNKFESNEIIVPTASLINDDETNSDNNKPELSSEVENTISGVGTTSELLTENNSPILAQTEPSKTSDKVNTDTTKPEFIESISMTQTESVNIDNITNSDDNKSEPITEKIRPVIMTPSELKNTNAESDTMTSTIIGLTEAIKTINRTNDEENKSEAGTKQVIPIILAQTETLETFINENTIVEDTDMTAKCSNLNTHETIVKTSDQEKITDQRLPTMIDSLHKQEESNKPMKEPSNEDAITDNCLVTQKHNSETPNTENNQTKSENLCEPAKGESAVILMETEDSSRIEENSETFISAELVKENTSPENVITKEDCVEKKSITYNQHDNISMSPKPETSTAMDILDQTKSEFVNASKMDTSEELKSTNNEIYHTDDRKRKHKSISETEYTVDENEMTKKQKVEAKIKCVKPLKRKNKHLGATFWPCDWRTKLCNCSTCLQTYSLKNVLFLIDTADTVSAYEDLGKIKTNSASQYEKGMEALSSLGHVQQINAMTEYNKMKEKLLEFLKTFKDKKEVVKEEDIKGFFAGMKPKREPDGVYFCR